MLLSAPPYDYRRIPTFVAQISQTARAAHVTLSVNSMVSLIILSTREKGEEDMNNIIYIIGLVVVVLFILSFFGLR